jgi:hypothetical protein
VLHLIRDADICSRTTLFDGDAISVREALYLGTPSSPPTTDAPTGVHLISTPNRAALVERFSW